MSKIREQLGHKDNTPTSSRIDEASTLPASPGSDPKIRLTPNNAPDNIPVLLDDNTPTVHSGPIDALEVMAGMQIGRYVLKDVIGAGGMGIVYVARDPELNRRVAIKLLQSTVSRTQARSGALLKEAKAMARLSHPNVCTVYEVGQIDDRVFIAMEYVDGNTLTRWLGRRPRTWRQIVDVMVSVGHGLHAAHQAGIVHCDLKPDNIMIGRDGRVRVMDFGLAGSLTEPDVRAPGGMAEAGRLVGTPGYIAPERLNFQPADARSDQFSLCVTLHAALYRQLPYPGESLTELRQAFDAQALRPPAATSKVPRWLHKILVRGLAIDPAQRYPSVRALVDELVGVPKQRQRWAITGAIAALALAGTVVGASLYGRAQSGDPCAGSERPIAELWNDRSQQQIQQALAASGLPYAQQQWERVAEVVNRYGTDWAAANRQACEATRVRGEQSAAMLDRRLRCLDDRRQEVAALIAMLGEADRRIAQRATQAALSLTDVSRCDARRALAIEPIGTDATGPASTLSRDLTHVKALHDLGEYKRSLARAERVIERAREIEPNPILARALRLSGLTRIQLGQIERGEQSLSTAVLIAEEIGDDLVKAEAWLDLIGAIGPGSSVPERPDSDARVWLQFADAGLQRAGGDRLLEPRLLRYRGDLQRAGGDLQAAEDDHTQALTLLEREFGPDHPEVIETLGSLGNVLRGQRRLDAAQSMHDRALSTARRVFGPEHPAVARALINRGDTERARGARDQAEQAYHRAHVLWRASLGSNHPSVAIALCRLGQLATGDGRHDDALTLYQQALGIEQSALAPTDPRLAVTLSHVGAAHLSKDQPARAIELLTRASEILGDAETATAARVRFAFARALWRTGQRARAISSARAAKAMWTELGAKAELEAVSLWLLRPE